MSLNRRVFYACEAVAFADFQNTPTTYKTARGVQSCGVNTSFNLEQVFELGQLDIYQNVENLPDVEVTIEKVLDGYPLLYHSATQGATAGTLVGRSNQRCNVAMSIFADTTTLSSGAPLSQVIMSGLYVSQLGYNFQTDGPSTEQVTLVGNNKVWLSSGFTFSGFTAAHGATGLSPLSASGVNRRQHFDMTLSRWPLTIRGIDGSGINQDVPSSGCYTVSIQSAKVSCNLGRQQILELGRKSPYFRYISFPVEVSTAVEVLAKDGDYISATEGGVYAGGNNLLDEYIYLRTQEGTKIDLGTKNKLNSVSYGGANASANGGNATITYNYRGFNTLTVIHPNDPTVALQG
jgi:hypothetical protein